LRVSLRSFVCAVSANRSLPAPAVAAIVLAASLAAARAQQPAPTAQVAPQPPPQPAARHEAQAVTPAQPGTPQLIYSPWYKFCGKANDPNAEQVCFTDQNSSGNSLARTDKVRPTDPKVFEE